MKVTRYTAEWCSPCKQAKPIWEKFKLLHPECDFEVVDVDKNPEIATKFNVMSIPNFISEIEGKINKQHIGLPTLENLEGLLI